MAHNIGIWVLRRSALERPYRYFWRKSILNFLLGIGGQKVKKYFWFNDVKLPNKLIYHIQLVKKAPLGVFWPIFVEIFDFGDPIDPSVIFVIHHWICLVKTLLLSTYKTIFWATIFKTKKVAKLKNFVSEILSTHFFNMVHILIVTPVEGSRKICLACCTYYQKILRKDISSFSRISEKNCQNQGFF